MANKTIKELIEEIRRILEDRNYCVYMLINFNKEEIYFGVTNNYHNRIYQHIIGEVKTTNHWNFRNENTKAEIIAQGLSKEEASKMAHNLEKRKKVNGFKILQTGGI